MSAFRRFAQPAETITVAAVIASIVCSLETRESCVKEEAYRRGRTVALRRSCTVLDHTHLETAYVLRNCCIERTSQEPGKVRDVSDTVPNDRFAEFAHRHPRACGGEVRLRLECFEPLDPQDRALARHLIFCREAPETQHCAQRSPAVAGSFLGTLRKCVIRPLTDYCGRWQKLGAHFSARHPYNVLAGMTIPNATWVDGAGAVWHRHSIEPPYRVAFDPRLLGLAGAIGAARTRKGKLHGKRA